MIPVDGTWFEVLPLIPWEREREHLVSKIEMAAVAVAFVVAVAVAAAVAVAVAAVAAAAVAVAVAAAVAVVVVVVAVAARVRVDGLELGTGFVEQEVPHPEYHVTLWEFLVEKTG